jgi:hypothetical protein
VLQKTSLARIRTAALSNQLSLRSPSLFGLVVIVGAFFETEMNGQIFIGYRREERRWSARSLYDRVCERPCAAGMTIS